MTSVLNESTSSDPPHLRVNLSSTPYFVKTFSGYGAGVSLPSTAFQTFYTLASTDNTNYAARFQTNVLVTSGTDAGKSYNQTCSWKFKRINGTVTLASVNPYENDSSYDAMTGLNNGQNIQINPFSNISVDFQFYFIAGNTYSYTYTLQVQSCP